MVRMALKSQYACFLCAVEFVTVVVNLAVGIPADAHFTTADASSTSRTLYAVDQSSAVRGSISVYDIDSGRNLRKTIPTVSNVGDIKGVAASAVTSKLHVAYRTRSGTALRVHDDAVLWNRIIDPDVGACFRRPHGGMAVLSGPQDHI
jgi:hypothetical protein